MKYKNHVRLERIFLACYSYSTRSYSFVVYYTNFAECVYEYHQQPPQDLICDPYLVQSTGVSLQCQVYASGSSSSYTVGWFHAPLGNSTPPLSRPPTSSTVTYFSSIRSVVISTLILQPRVNKDQDSPGSYYCQVLLTDQTETVPSDNFTLYAADDNHYLPHVPCYSTVSRLKNEMKCADRMSQDACPTPPQNAASTSAMTLEEPGTITKSGGEIDFNSDLLGYQIFVFVLTPVAFVMLVILIIIGGIYSCRQCRQSTRNQQTTAVSEGNDTRGVHDSM